MPQIAVTGPATPSKESYLLQGAGNLLVVGLFTLLAVSSYRHFVSSRTPASLGVLAVNTLFLTLFLARRPAKTETRSPSLWVLGMAGTALPLLLRPSDGSPLLRLGLAVQVAGLVMVVGALLSLRRSFAVVPANRGIREGGMYRLVRHPVYLSELIALLGVVLANSTAANLVIWVCECGLQLGRACAEERFLSADPAYCLYREQVRYRLIPGLV